LDACAGHSPLAQQSIEFWAFPGGYEVLRQPTRLADNLQRQAIWRYEVAASVGEVGRTSAEKTGRIVSINFSQLVASGGIGKRFSLS
jgi:hypothetical protein